MGRIGTKINGSYIDDFKQLYDKNKMTLYSIIKKYDSFLKLCCVLLSQIFLGAGSCDPPPIYISDVWIQGNQACIGVSRNGFQDDGMVEGMFSFRNANGNVVGGLLAWNTYPGIAYSSWNWGAHYRYEISLQVLNAQEAFLTQVFQSENDYVNQSNAYADATANAERALWQHIPAYGLLGVNYQINNVWFNGSFNINGTTSWSASDATTRLNNAFSDICTSLKNPNRNIMVYTLNISGPSDPDMNDDPRMKACASTPLQHFTADPSVPGQIATAIQAITDDILASSIKSSLTGKSW